jgi:hypothetical protein
VPAVTALDRHRLRPISCAAASEIGGEVYRQQAASSKVKMGGLGGLKMSEMRAERVKGIEPSCQAWEACVLPLNYTRRANWLEF